LGENRKTKDSSSLEINLKRDSKRGQSLNSRVSNVGPLADALEGNQSFYSSHTKLSNDNSIRKAAESLQNKIRKISQDLRTKNDLRAGSSYRPRLDFLKPSTANFVTIGNLQPPTPHFNNIKTTAAFEDLKTKAIIKPIFAELKHQGSRNSSNKRGSSIKSNKTQDQKNSDVAANSNSQLSKETSSSRIIPMVGTRSSNCSSPPLNVFSRNSDVSSQKNSNMRNSINYSEKSPLRGEDNGSQNGRLLTGLLVKKNKERECQRDPAPGRVATINDSFSGFQLGSRLDRYSTNHIGQINKFESAGSASGVTSMTNTVDSNKGFFGKITKPSSKLNPKEQIAKITGANPTFKLDQPKHQNASLHSISKQTIPNHAESHSRSPPPQAKKPAQIQKTASKQSQLDEDSLVYHPQANLDNLDLFKEGSWADPVEIIDSSSTVRQINESIERMILGKMVG